MFGLCASPPISVSWDWGCLHELGINKDLLGQHRFARNFSFHARSICEGFEGGTVTMKNWMASKLDGWNPDSFGLPHHPLQIYHDVLNVLGIASFENGTGQFWNILDDSIVTSCYSCLNNSKK